MPNSMKLHILRANSLRVATYIRGRGPKLLLLLHGFPDDAASWLGLMEALDDPQYTIAAPYLRGYSPTSTARDGRYSLRVLGQDVLSLIEVMGFERAAIVGHDWGALSAYAASQLAPNRLSHLIALSVPPPKTFLTNLVNHPGQLRRSAYILWFQLPTLSRWLLMRDDLALVEQLWRRWSPSWEYSMARQKKVKATLRQRRSASAALRYYQALLADAALDPHEWRASLKLALKPIRTPSLLISGEEDGCISPQMFDGYERAFNAPVRLELLKGCGHFPQHERPDALQSLIREFIRSR